MVTATKPIPFVDLKSQYAALREELDPVIRETIEQTAFIGGKRVKDLEEQNNVADQHPEVLEKIRKFAEGASTPIRAGKVLDASTGYQRPNRGRRKER